jgi:hypothetical protein
MPLKPIRGKLDMAVATAEDVLRLFERGISLSRQNLSSYAYEDYLRDLEDHFFYVGAICPEHFRPLQETLVTLRDEQLVNFCFTFHTWLYLLEDAPDICVEHIMRRLLGHGEKSLPMLKFVLEQMLAGISTPAALEALAAYATSTNKRDEFENYGFWIPEHGRQAVLRFTRQRQAVQFRPFEGTQEDLEQRQYPVGLPVSAVVHDPTQDVIVWHYCSFDLAAVSGLPPISARRLHLVSPPLYYDWTVLGVVGEDGRYQDPVLSCDHDMELEDTIAMKEQAIKRQDSGRGQLALLPYDDQLIYRNGHTQLTPGVVGDVGGPPVGLYLNPSCPTCGRLMFHVSTVTNNVRAYGDGFRCLFVCEECMVAASHATSFN